MRFRVAVVFVLGFLGVLLYTTHADASGRPGKAIRCERDFRPKQLAEDECGAIFDLHVDLADVPRLPDVVVAGPYGRSTTFAARAPTLFADVGIGAGVLFPGHFGIRFFALDVGWSTAATYQDESSARLDRHNAITANLDLGGLILHGREHTQDGYFSYQLAIAPNVATVGVFDAGSTSGATFGNLFFGVRANGQGCYGTIGRACITASVNVFQFGHFFDGGTVGLSFPIVW